MAKYRLVLNMICSFKLIIYYIYIYAFSRDFYPKRLTVHSGYTLFVSMYVLLVYLYTVCIFNAPNSTSERNQYKYSFKYFSSLAKQKQLCFYFEN